MIFKNNELEYCDLIASIGELNRSNRLYWFSSSLASKNDAIFPFRNLLEESEGYVFQYKSNILTLIYVLLKQLYRRCFLFPVKYKLSSKCSSVDRLFITHLSNSHWKGEEYQDPLWKPLSDYIIRQNESCCHIAIVSNLSEDRQKELHKKHDSLMLYEQFLTLFDILKAFVLTLGAGIRFPETVIFDKRDIKQRLLAHYKNEKYNGEIFSNICKYFAFYRIIKQIKPKYIYWPWENHSWEKLLILVCQKYSPSTKLIGHQHSTIPPYLLNHFPGSKETEYAPYPDKLVTTGQKSYDILNRYGHFPDNCLESGCALRYEAIQDIFLNYKKIGKNIGFALSIDRNIAKKMLQIISELATKLPNYSFYVKCHPYNPIELIQQNTKTILNKINIESDLYIFLKTIDILVYFNTTVSFEAAAMGIPLVYVNFPNHQLRDSMFENHILKWTVETNDELCSAINKIKKLPLPELNKQRKKARQYVEEYFYPCTDENLEKFLK